MNVQEEEFWQLPACSGGPKKTLFLCYDGLTDPLGRSQVLPYLAGLAARGHRISIISLEKPDRYERDREAVGRACAAAGISWHPLKYQQRPLVVAAFFNSKRLRLFAERLHRQQRFDVIHCRSLIPGSAGLRLKRRYGPALLFDMRGFWPEERVDGNLWSLSNPVFKLIYRHFKRVEAAILRECDHVISLTHAGKRELRKRKSLKGRADKISVIPCCVDFDAFSPPGEDQRTNVRARLGIAPSERVVAYLGSIGTWYMLDEMLDFFRCYAERYPGARFLFITGNNPEEITSKARQRKVDPKSLIILSAPREQLPELIAAADLGLFFIKPAYSKIASSPTKMGEMLALGLPLVANGNVGDVEKVLRDTGCGAVITEFNDAAYENAIADVASIQLTREEIRRRARPLLDSKAALEAYDRIYGCMGNSETADRRSSGNERLNPLPEK